MLEAKLKLNHSLGLRVCNERQDAQSKIVCLYLFFDPSPLFTHVLQ